MERRDNGYTQTCDNHVEQCREMGELHVLLSEAGIEIRSFIWHVIWSFDYLVPNEQRLLINLIPDEREREERAKFFLIFSVRLAMCLRWGIDANWEMGMKGWERKKKRQEKRYANDSQSFCRSLNSLYSKISSFSRNEIWVCQWMIAEDLFLLCSLVTNGLLFVHLPFPPTEMFRRGSIIVHKWYVAIVPCEECRICSLEIAQSASFRILSLFYDFGSRWRGKNQKMLLVTRQLINLASLFFLILPTLFLSSSWGTFAFVKN